MTLLLADGAVLLPLKLLRVEQRQLSTELRAERKALPDTEQREIHNHFYQRGGDITDMERADMEEAGLQMERAAIARELRRRGVDPRNRHEPAGARAITLEGVRPRGPAGAPPLTGAPPALNADTRQREPRSEGDAHPMETPGI